MAPDTVDKPTHPMSMQCQPGVDATSSATLPDAILIDPESLGWRSTAQWLAEALATFDAPSGFVAFGDTAGILARGCFREWTWALERDLPCAPLDTAAGQLCRLGGVTLLEDGLSHRRYAPMTAAAPAQ
jgi:hypothetical protein